MTLFGPLHVALLAAIALAGFLLVQLCRRVERARRPVRLLLGIGLALNELVWWRFRYSHEGVHLWNLPLQLCDVTLWMTALACITLTPALVEFAYFAGFAGAAMALLTPDLWRPWPQYPAIYFFVAHAGIAIGIAVLVVGKIAPLRNGAVWRAFGMLIRVRRAGRGIQRHYAGELHVPVPQAGERFAGGCAGAVAGLSVCRRGGGAGAVLAIVVAGAAAGLVRVVFLDARQYAGFGVGIERGRSEPLFEHIAIDHGVARQGAGEIEILFPAGGIFGGGKVVNFQAPTSHILGVCVLHED